MVSAILEFHHRTSDSLDDAARRLLRGSPELLREASTAEPTAHTAAGSVLAIQHGRARWAAEHAVREALKRIDSDMQRAIGREVSP